MHGLMGFGAVVDDQAPVELGAAALASPILSTASLIASQVMLKMAAVPKSKRVAEMVATLNRVQHGLGDSARADFVRRAAASAANKKDQAMFDAVRAALADYFVRKSLAMAPGMSGLGTTVAEARGQTSQGVNDANAIFCSYVAGSVAMIGGVLDQTGTGSGTGALTGSSLKAGQQAGCNAGDLVINGQNTLAQARLAQEGRLQTMAQQEASDARFMRYVMVGGGALAALGIGYALLKKAG
jgi:hypothetical protein